MNITEITVSAGRTFNHPYESYSNFRQQVTMKATVDPVDDPGEQTKRLQALAERLAEEAKQETLKRVREELEGDAIFDDDPVRVDEVQQDSDRPY